MDRLRYLVINAYEIFKKNVSTIYLNFMPFVLPQTLCKNKITFLVVAEEIATAN